MDTKKIFIVYRNGVIGAFYTKEKAEEFKSSLNESDGAVYYGETPFDACLDAADSMQSVKVFFEGMEMGSNAVDIDAEEILGALKNA